MKFNHVDNTITTLEFCAGYGGIGLGLKKIFGERLRCLAYSELEGFAQANLISKMEKGLLDVAPIWNDVKTFPNESFYKLVDILIAGYPCQPFSVAGKRNGENDPRHLWPSIRNSIRIIRPRLCFLENVEGHISLGLSTVVSDLEELGYKVSWGLFSAREVGASHKRKRMFILADSTSGQFSKRCWTEQDEECTQKHRFDGCCGIKQKNTTDLGDSECSRLDARRDQAVQSQISEFKHTNFPNQPGIPQFEWEPPRQIQIKSKVGGNIDGIEFGNSLPECPGLSDSELDEIYEWMVKTTSRHDELRLLGNGVVPDTAKIAFLTLLEEINK